MSKLISRYTPMVAIPLLVMLTGAARTSHGRTATLSDAQVLQTLADINQGEVTFSQLGVDKGRDADVKAFATSMVSIHGTALTHVQTVMTNSKLGHETSTLSTQLQADEKKAEAGLKTQAEGPDFDLYFMCAEVRLHRGALKSIDDSLMPSAKEQSVRDEVTSTRPVVNQHLQNAQDLVEKMDKAASATDKKSATHGTEHARTVMAICKAHGGA